MSPHHIFHSGFEMDSQQQQFCLKWNSFGSNLATSFSNLFKSESLADVTLFCDGVTFKAHKLILAACSKHLADLFETAPQHQNLLVILDGTSSSNMAALLEFMYKGEVHVSQDALSSFLKAAECLQVKGLSIEHEKLAVAQSHPARPQDMEAAQPPPDSPGRKGFKILKEDTENNQPNHQQSSPSPSYSPKMSPYMQHQYRPYERLSSSSTPQYEMKHPRSPNELVQENRTTVLRDGSKKAVSPTPLSLAYRPSSSSSCSAPPHNEADASPDVNYDATDRATALICPEINNADRCRDPGCPEDLRIKMEPVGIKMEQDEPPSSTGGGSGNYLAGLSPMNHTGSPNGNIGLINKFEYDRDKTDLIPTTLWNSTTGKLRHHKQATVNTPDGKKLKCPFCERLYGYETNLRAHIRQRHQGIRVPCPYCTRSFTRNNTVRRHIAREHKNEPNLKSFPHHHQILNP
ncbi:zinc finger protein chinmo isoform X2 [Dendroctonus ponderosae]|uniref:BTB domain-containing protein n=1 Tax=Dendroctonus ponderosae TaxID=77166 RepID=A0AAR5PG05_DENPD|nr:zinc finger protein chinmo isoform X2 [Dendroctonus ponderosae]